MNHARVGELPIVQIAETSWFRSVPEEYQYEPPLFRPSKSRFNPGGIQAMYFAPDQLLARFEARDVLGQWFGRIDHAVPSRLERHVVVEYRVRLGPRPAIVDVRLPQLAKLETSVQEMTGDWHSYGLRGTEAPTQVLARAVLGRADAPMGLTAPSARNPLQDNLILFANRLPSESIFFHDVHVWHESQLAERPGV